MLGPHFRRFSRVQRRQLLAMMNKVNPEHALAEMCLRREMWLRLGENLHPGEYATRYTRIAGLFKALPDKAYPKSWAGQVEHALSKRNMSVLLAKLPRLDWELQRRRELGARYHALLADVNVGLLTVREGRDSVWGQYTVTVPDRPAVQAALKAVGIPTAVHYPRPLHQQLAYERFAPAGGCPVAEQLAQQVMSLPMSPDLGEVDQDRVVAALAAAVGRRG